MLVILFQHQHLVRFWTGRKWKIYSVFEKSFMIKWSLKERNIPMYILYVDFMIFPFLCDRNSWNISQQKKEWVNIIIKFITSIVGNSIK